MKSWTPDEAEYLLRNVPVRDGAFVSGRAHYLKFGFKENRSTGRRKRREPLKLPFPKGVTPGRRDKILANLNLTAMSGIEIGALDRSLVQRPEGDISYIDHATTPELKKNTGGMPFACEFFFETPRNELEFVVGMTSDDNNTAVPKAGSG